MTKKEKLDKLTKDFSLLSEEKQNYILGVLQALAFAHEMTGQTETEHFDSGKTTESV